MSCHGNAQLEQLKRERDQLEERAVLAETRLASTKACIADQARFYKRQFLQFAAYRVLSSSVRCMSHRVVFGSGQVASYSSLFDPCYGVLCSVRFVTSHVLFVSCPILFVPRFYVALLCSFSSRLRSLSKCRFNFCALGAKT